MKVLCYCHLILSLKWFILLGTRPGVNVGSSPEHLERWLRLSPGLKRRTYYWPNMQQNGL